MNYNTKKVWVNTDYRKSETHFYSNVSECCDRIANSYKDSIVFIAEWHVKQLLAEKDAEIESLKESKLKWISTKDQMPDYDGKYLCLVIEKENCGTQYKRQYIMSNYMNAFVTPNDKIIKVTHWMPLPELPINNED